MTLHLYSRSLAASIIYFVLSGFVLETGDEEQRCLLSEEVCLTCVVSPSVLTEFFLNLNPFEAFFSLVFCNKHRGFKCSVSPCPDVASFISPRSAVSSVACPLTLFCRLDGDDRLSKQFTSSISTAFERAGF